MDRRPRNRGTALHSALAALLVGLAAWLLPTARTAAQAQLTFTSAAANWHDALDDTPGSQPGDPAISNGTPTSSISWGTSSGPQSGYDVTITIPDPQMFPVATFAHRNFPVSDPSLTSVQLDFVLDFLVNGIQTGPLTFTFTFTHDETPNNQSPCPYPTPPGEGCTDRVTFISAPAPTTFTVGGKTYTLSMSFLDGAGNPVTEFITREGGLVNTADLYGQFTLVPPVLEVTKSGPATLTVGQSGLFTVDVRNSGPNDAWNTTVRDVVPNGPTRGMCDATPQVLSAQVFAADGVTPVPGKGPLVPGSDYALSWAGAPSCELSLAMLTPAGAIDTDERLIVTYYSQLDADSQDGAVLTNVAGATEWFDDEISNPDRVTYTRTLTDGTPGTLDHEDSHAVTVDLQRYLFEKTVRNVTTGTSPATQAGPGDRLRYQLRIQNTGTAPLDALALRDEVDRLNTPPVFAPGTLTVVTVPAGADASNTTPTGGAAGTGVLDVRNLSVAPGAVAVVEFEVELAPVIASGRYATNQSQLEAAGAPFALSDDPGINGAADPFVAGDEDPTRVLIVSAPMFRVQKISTDLTGDPSLLLAGETLRYTITVKNVGNADASDATLRDAIPANTSYVAGSTTLNGAAVPDAAGGVAPFTQGMPIHSPQNPTPGALPADASASTANVATLTFDVVIDPAAVDGTIISNQAFVSAPLGGVIDQPSDDPDTAVPDDPTRDVVGSTPLLFAPKRVALGVDGGTPGIVDPGDVLHYTIEVRNSGAVPATGATLTDAVPANTTYVADSTMLNGLAVGRPDGGVSPLSAGIPISSSDLTPPLPGAGAGTINPGQVAVLEFDLQVNAGVPPGTLISNQALIATNELPGLPTDGDGNPATGPEPTVVVVGDAQQLMITKAVAVVGGGPALAGGMLEYVVQVRNVSAVPAYGVVITDDVAAASPGALALVAGSATLDGALLGVTEAGTSITADYFAAYGPLAPGASAVLRFRATLDPGLAIGTRVTNTGVVTWDATRTASASVSIDVGGMVGVGVLAGAAWHDANFDRVQDASERALEGWTVELSRNGMPVTSVLTDANGAYRIAGVAPTAPSGDWYALRFRAPGAGATTASLGTADSVYTNGPQQISNIPVISGANLLGLNLPITPNGVVYDALQRAPLAGASLTLMNAAAGAPLPAECFDDAAQQGQVTLGAGYYKFDVNFSDAACPSGASYVIAVAAPGTGFTTGYSQIIPPSSTAAAPLAVPACPGTPADAILATAQHCEAQPSELAPPASVPARSAETAYYVHLTLDGSNAPGSSQIFNNHIPLDPDLTGAVTLAKSTPMVNATRGQLVPYEIVVANQLGAPIPDLSLVDVFPAGFQYVEGSARLDGVPSEPTRSGRELLWENVGIGADTQRTLALLLAVGAGVSEGEFVNRAQARSSLTGALFSPDATARVRVVPDPTFDCTDVLGKVFDDADRDGVQDRGERGLPGVRVITARGLLATTDRHGRFHITCAVTPHESRGSNFVLKLDDRTLPTGYRMSTPARLVKRATSGKALRVSFGASIHHVVGLDVADAVFEPDSAELREHWRPRVPLLVEELRKRPSVLRLSYLADLESAALVERRIEALSREIEGAWGGAALPIETEVFWRRGAPVEPNGEAREVKAGGWRSLLRARDAELQSPEGELGRGVERHLPLDRPLTQWALDPEALRREGGDRLEQREVVRDRARIVKLSGVVPPIRFASGVAQIPPASVEKLRAVLASMQHLANVRLHLVGHADDQPLSSRLAGVFGDNEGLSRERAGEVAEFLQTALALPPEAIAFDWAGDAQPIASNASDGGRAQNRRVEVEVWYDETEPVAALEDVVVPEELRRFKVCRTQTVCKLRFQDGHARRARIRNLIAPLHYGGDESVAIPPAFVRQVEHALANLKDRTNVTLKLVGFSDDAPLTGRAERIYGTQLALSKARAHRVALALRDALALPSAAIASDGVGAARPIASNASERGRALNRRIEVELWYDDPLQELPDEPQLCPEAGDGEVITRVYEPSFGALAPLALAEGEARVPPGYADVLRRALAEVAGKSNARLRFVGYTANERLDRRTALAYGDDIGLSAARARRALERLEPELAGARLEHEGRGYVHSADVVNAGFLAGAESLVAVEVVYDELLPSDALDGVDLTPLTRELTPQNPFALNLMRISVDGEPVDDPGRSFADTQRCTDVALERADVQFGFDGLAPVPRLTVAAQQGAIALAGAAAAGAAEPSVRFATSSNYGHFIARSEVRIFERGASREAKPLAVIPVDASGDAEWRPEPADLPDPTSELQYLLRAYDASGRFDETSPQPLRVVGMSGAAQRDIASASAVQSGAGPVARGIPLGNVGTVTVRGAGIPPQHTVSLAGTSVPVDAQGRFAADVLLPVGLHSVELAVLDEEGNGELFLRDLDLSESEWLYTAVADVTLATSFGDGPAGALVGDDAPYDPDSIADGRLAFFLAGKFGEGWGLTASADTQEGAFADLFSNFLDKSPDALFRRMDPDRYMPTFGDDGTVAEAAPTSGKFFARLSKHDSHLLWGNFHAGYLANELAHVDRGLYGANLHYQSLATTGAGEQRITLDAFAAEPGTVASREELRLTGGSLYWLNRQDLLAGSERLRIEVRDKDSGLVSSVVHLRAGEDYDIDYLQGRVLLSEPVASTVEDSRLVRSSGLSGNEAWLVVQYEFTPGFTELDSLAFGGQGEWWLNDHLQFGATANQNQADGADSSLYAGHVILRKSADSWIKLQAGRSDGLVSSSLFSNDGGFSFFGAPSAGPTSAAAGAYRAELSVGVSDFLAGRGGRLHVYGQILEAGYSAPGQTALTDTNVYGGQLALPLTQTLALAAKADSRSQQNGLATTAGEVDLAYRVTPSWTVSGGVRSELREDDSPLVPVTQEEGNRTDAVVQAAFAPGNWRAYAFGQGTLTASGSREANHRGGIGGARRFGERLLLEGEVSHGELGPAARIGTSYQASEGSQRYLTYALDNDSPEDRFGQRRGNLISGARVRLSDSGSVFVEDRYQHGVAADGLTRSIGLSLAPANGWNLGGNLAYGTLIDRQTAAETKRTAGGARLGYAFASLQLSSGVEYRFDETEQTDGAWSDRKTWLFRNSLKLQLNPSWQLVGKFNHSTSDSSLGDFYDGDFTEAVLGYAYRPVESDRLNALVKYTYFYNLPTAEQLTPKNVSAQFVQRSHVASVDVTFDLTEWWSIGGKYAQRIGEAALDRADPQFFDNGARLFILRNDLRFRKAWEASFEARLLELPDLNERKTGALMGISRYFGEHFKIGVGYNFTDFSEDLTDLSYDDHGLFLNLVGSL